MPKKPTETKETPTDATTEILTKILERLEKLEEATLKPITSQVASFLETNVAPPSQPDITSYPVPTDWRQMVDSVLNKDFGLELTPSSEAPLVTITVVVPKKYSSATEDQLMGIGGRDIRPKVITLAGGVNELKEWAELVYKSFSPEIQAIIVADRNK